MTTEFQLAATVKRLQHDRVARLSASNVLTVVGWMVSFTEELNAYEDSSTLYNKIRTECEKLIGNKEVSEARSELSALIAINFKLNRM